MRDMLIAAGFTDIKIQIKENAADIISGWMPGTGAEKYVTSAHVSAVKPLSGGHIRDDPKRRSDVSCCPPMEVDTSGAAPATGC